MAARDHERLGPPPPATIPQLFTDASIFPTASGLNPMLTIMAIAHPAAQGIKAAL